MSGGVSRVWVLNLDAEDELAAPDVPRDPFAAIAARPQLALALAALVKEDVVLARGARAPLGAIGRAFSPTPRAIEAMVRAGALPAPAPDVSVLRRVADRRFGLDLGVGHVPGAEAFGGPDVLASFAQRVPGPRVLKRLFAFAGRGRLLSRGGPATAAEEAFVSRALREDGAVVCEPWLDRTLDVAIHGFVTRAGVATIGSPTVQDTTPAGAWRATRPSLPGELGVGEMGALEDQAWRAALHLHAAGYFGPFGVDGFRWISAVGTTSLVARCEVNARYTMGWAIGMGDSRPDLAEHDPR